MCVGSAGMTLTSEDMADLRIQAMYHIQKAEQIFQKISARSKHPKTISLVQQAHSIAEQIQELTKIMP